jgi:soluble cytochrome b562
MSETLPSLDDFTESELPSVEELITEDKLPSVEEFIEEEKEEEIVEEDNNTITLEDAEGNAQIEITDVIQAPEWGELVRMVNDVRESIPDIPDVPEIKYYDNELKELSEHLEEVRESIPTVPEIKYYDTEVETICEQIDLVREEIKNLPEVKYYDKQLDSIEEKIKNLPQPKYYDGEIEAICEAVDKVRSEIPTFPKWVNEVNEVPDFSWIGKTFSVIDDDFVKVEDHMKDLKTKFDSDLEELTENLDLKDFEKRVEIEELNTAKDKIYKELKEAALKIWSHHDEFKDDDRKLKKSVLSKLNETKQNIEKQISELDNKSYESDKNLKGYFEGLKEEIANLPEVKYYDDNINELKSELKKDLFDLDKKYKDTALNITEIYKVVEEIKEQQENLEEIYNDRPLTPDPDLKQGDDPLTPISQKFATLQDLAANYRLFVNRVEQQLYTIGGGGAGFIKDLDDVDFAGITTGSLLMYEASSEKWVGIASTALGSSTLTGLSDVDDSNLGDGRFLRYDATAGDFTFDPVSSTNLELIGGDIQGGILTTTSTSAAAVISVSATTYRSVNYQVQIVQGTNYNSTTINVIHDGTNVYMSEYGTINQPTGIATFGADISSGALRLLGYPSSSSSTTFKSIFTALEA